MEVLDARRLKVLGLTWSRARILVAYLVKERKIRNAYFYLWSSLFVWMRA